MLDSRQQELVFKALSNAVRRRILDYLKKKPLTTGEICSYFPKMDRCTVMQHLRVLEDADLVIVRREGRLRWNYLNVRPILDIHDRWISRYAADSARLLAQIQEDLEER